MKTLLLSAYDAESHRYWRDGLKKTFPAWEWHELILPARNFSWRIRGNPISWFDSSLLTREFDLVLATSMVDLATLRGLHPELARCPNWLYFHENQFAYPESKGRKREHLVEPQMVQIYSALAADRCIFNSEYNRDSFLSGAEVLLKKFPDQVPNAVARELTSQCANSTIIPVSLINDGEETPSKKPRKSGETIQIIWNHRWEYDKGPERFLALVEMLPENLPLRFHVVGQSFRVVPKELDKLNILLKKRSWLGQWGYLESKADYLTLLDQCDIVLSTSLHDFQGLSVLEGISRGCIPLLPDRLVYPQYVGDNFLYASHDDVQAEAQYAALKLQEQIKKCDSLSAGLPSLGAFSEERCQKAYTALIEDNI